MADRELWYANFGPLLYDDEELATGWYPSPYDLLTMRAALFSQAYCTDAPVNDLELARRMDIDGTPGTILKAGADGLPADSVITEDATYVTIGSRILTSAAMRLSTSPGAGKVIKGDADGDFSWETLSTIETDPVWVAWIGATRTENTFFTGPAAAPAAVPTFRALVDADFPATLNPTFVGIRGTGHSGLGNLGVIDYSNITSAVVSCTLNVAEQFTGAAVYNYNEAFEVYTSVNIDALGTGVRFYYGGRVIIKSQDTCAIDLGAIIALYGRAEHHGSGTVALLYGHAGVAYTYGPGITTVQGGFYAVSGTIGAATVGTNYALRIGALNNANGSIGTNYGLHIEDQNVGTITVATWSIYTEGGSHYFKGSIINDYLTASLPIVTDASKVLVSLAYTGATSFRKNLGLETDDSPTFAGLVVPGISPAGNFVLTQNAVAVMTSESASAVVNTLYLKEGKVGIGTIAPQGIFSVGTAHYRATSGNGRDVYIGAEAGEAAGDTNGGNLILEAGMRYGGGGISGNIDFWVGVGSTTNKKVAYIEGLTGNTILGNPGALGLFVGRVGIGDAAPGELLDVAGNINATGVLKIDDVQVVSNRVIDARISNTPNTGDSDTNDLIDAMRDALLSHGLMAAA